MTALPSLKYISPKPIAPAYPDCLFMRAGLAMDPQGRLFVSDGARQQILQLDSKGREVRAWGKEGTGAGEFKTPHLITADRQGNLYAAEVGGQRVQRLKRVSVPQ